MTSQKKKTFFFKTQKLYIWDLKIDTTVFKDHNYRVKYVYKKGYFAMNGRIAQNAQDKFLIYM